MKTTKTNTDYCIATEIATAVEAAAAKTTKKSNKNTSNFINSKDKNKIYQRNASEQRSVSIQLEM